jgi:hypothetical protein
MRIFFLRKPKITGIRLIALIVLTTIVVLNLAQSVTFAQSGAIAQSSKAVEIAQSCGQRIGRTVAPRGPLDPLVPYVISPRQTLLLSDRPVFRWNAVPGSDRYTVQLRNGETVVWTQQISTHELAYPASEEGLKPGIDYTLVIQSSNGHSSQEDTVASSFQVLAEPEVEQIRQAETLFANQSNSDATALIKARFYQGAGLDAEAIATLEKHLQQGSQSPKLYRQLGELYVQSGLNLIAENYLRQASDFTAISPHEQAQIQMALGMLYQAIGEYSEAKRWLTKAQQTYQQINNQLKVQELQEQLANLTTATT